MVTHVITGRNINNSTIVENTLVELQNIKHTFKIMITYSHTKYAITITENTHSHSICT